MPSLVACSMSGCATRARIYRATEVAVRARAAAPLAEVLRVLSAGLVAGGPLSVSFDTDPGAELRSDLAGLGITVAVYDDQTWARALEAAAVRRVRAVGFSAAEVARVTSGRPDLAVYAQPVVEAGRIELEAFVLEQAVSVTAHRFGTPRDLAPWLRPGAVAISPAAPGR